MLLAINKNMFLNDSSTPVFQQSNDLCLLRLMVLNSPFEWSEFKEFVETQTDGLIKHTVKAIQSLMNLEHHLGKTGQDLSMKSMEN